MAEAVFEGLHVVGASHTSCCLVARLLTLAADPLSFGCGICEIGSDACVGLFEERPTFLLTFGAGLTAGVVTHGVGLSITDGESRMAYAAAEDATHAFDGEVVVGFECQFHSIMLSVWYAYRLLIHTLVLRRMFDFFLSL